MKHGLTSHQEVVVHHVEFVAQPEVVRIVVAVEEGKHSEEALVKLVVVD